MRFKRNKRENLQITEYNKKIRKIIPEQIRKDSDIQKNNKKIMCNKVFNNIVNTFESNVSKEKDNSTITDHSSKSTQNTFREEAKKKISKRLTVLNANLKCKNLPQLTINTSRSNLKSYDNKHIKGFLSKETVNRQDLLNLVKKVDLTKIEFPVTKSMLRKYLDYSTYKQEKHLILDVLQTEDPNGLVNIIQKLKRCINQFEVKGKVLDSKKEDYTFHKLKLVNKEANHLDKQLLQSMYYHANAD